MFDFVAAFKRGVKAARDLNKYQFEIDEVFSELSNKFLEATNGEFTIVRSASLVSSASAALDVLAGTPPRSQTQSNGTIFMRSTKDANRKVKLANWVQQPKGFTFVLQFEQREIISKSKAELGAALEELLSAPIVGKAYLSLFNSIQSDLRDKKESEVHRLRAVESNRVGGVIAVKSAAKAGVSGRTAVSAMAKPAAAKPAAKAAAKPAAAKPVAAKAAAKPAAAKPVAAKAAAKPAAAKPVAAKPAVKKPAAAKPAVAAQPRPPEVIAPKAEVFNEGVEMKPGVAQSPPAPAAQ
ncbi:MULTISPECIES: hypothetical protein [unclassified Pseudomonas]|uniref:hypothetical protein n=1 Tax=unclassified Pseudomonas TaxID=196821 RepID=UPI0015B12B72|nr:MULTISPECIES: hypothetical protein [unclassified Pseudomonas]